MDLIAPFSRCTGPLQKGVGALNVHIFGSVSECGWIFLLRFQNLLLALGIWLSSSSRRPIYDLM